MLARIHIVWFVVSLLSLGVFMILLFKYSRTLVASEGYDTNEAAWNYLIRSGEIRFQLSPGWKIESLEGEGETQVASEREAYVKLGYGNFTTKVTYRDNAGTKYYRVFRTDKFNHWNRVLYVQKSDGSFHRIDNGVDQGEAVSIQKG